MVRKALPSKIITTTNMAISPIPIIVTGLFFFTIPIITMAIPANAIKRRMELKNIFLVDLS
jgi:hypothetical protein